MDISSMVNKAVEAFKKDDTLLSASNQKDVNMLVSTFRGEDGHTYRAVVNLDRKKNIEAHLTFAPGVTAQRRLFDGTWQTLTGPMDAVGALSQDGGVRMWMAPGQMDLIREA